MNKSDFTRELDSFLSGYESFDDFTHYIKEKLFLNKQFLTERYDDVIDYETSSINPMQSILNAIDDSNPNHASIIHLLHDIGKVDFSKSINASENFSNEDVDILHDPDFEEYAMYQEFDRMSQLSFLQDLVESNKINLALEVAKLQPESVDNLSKKALRTLFDNVFLNNDSSLLERIVNNKNFDFLEKNTQGENVIFSYVSNVKNFDYSIYDDLIQTYFDLTEKTNIDFEESIERTNDDETSLAIPFIDLSERIENLRRSGGNTTLTEVNIVKALKNSSFIDFNKANEYGVLPLHYSAARKINNEVFNVIIEKTKDINALTEDGLTALNVACMNGDRDKVRFLLKHKASPSVDGESESPIFDAANNKHWNCVYEIIERDIKSGFLEQTDNSGRTLLHIAIEQNDISAVNRLVQSGHIDFKSTFDNGDTYLHIAARHLSSIEEGSNQFKVADMIFNKVLETSFDGQVETNDKGETPSSILQHSSNRIVRDAAINYSDMIYQKVYVKEVESEGSNIGLSKDRIETLKNHNNFEDRITQSYARSQNIKTKVSQSKDEQKKNGLQILGDISGLIADGIQSKQFAGPVIAYMIGTNSDLISQFAETYTNLSSEASFIPVLATVYAVTSITRTGINLANSDKLQAFKDAKHYISESFNESKIYLSTLAKSLKTYFERSNDKENSSFFSKMEKEVSSVPSSETSNSMTEEEKYWVLKQLSNEKLKDFIYSDSFFSADQAKEHLNVITAIINGASDKHFPTVQEVESFIEEAGHKTRKSSNSLTMKEFQIINESDMEKLEKIFSKKIQDSESESKTKVRNDDDLGFGLN